MRLDEIKKIRLICDEFDFLKNLNIFDEEELRYLVNRNSFFSVQRMVIPLFFEVPELLDEYGKYYEYSIFIVLKNHKMIQLQQGSCIYDLLSDKQVEYSDIQFILTVEKDFPTESTNKKDYDINVIVSKINKNISLKDIEAYYNKWKKKTLKDMGLI